jgi:hypothetical protein
MPGRTLHVNYLPCLEIRNMKSEIAAGEGCLRLSNVSPLDIQKLYTGLLARGFK